MLAEAIKKIQELSDIRTKTIKVQETNFTTEQLHPVLMPDQHLPMTLNFLSLTGLIDYLDQNIDNLDRKKLCFVVAPRSVELCGPLQPDNCNKRFCFAVANYSSKSFDFGMWFDLEDFIIRLQSQFVQDDSTDTLLAGLGNIASRKIRENKDNGFTQTIEVKIGIELRAEVTIQNPIQLSPFMTFAEVEQPLISCVIRLKETADNFKCAIFSADGGLWMPEASRNIKKWLKIKTNDQIPIFA